MAIAGNISSPSYSRSTGVTADGWPQSLFESIVVHASDVVLVTEAEPLGAVDGGPKVIYVNPAFTRMTGYLPEEIIGQTPRVLQSPNTDRAELDRLRGCLQRWEPVEVELLNVKKDGTPFWVQINITPVADGTGWWTHWVAVQRDITVRKLRENALAVMLDSTSDLLLVVRDGRVVSASPSAERLLGRTAADLIGHQVDKLTHPEDRAVWHGLSTPSTAPRFGRQAVAELRLLPAQGGVRWIEASAADIGTGDLGEVVIDCADISARVQAQAELQVVNERFTGAFADAPIGMAVTDAAGRLVLVNTALGQLLHLGEQELLARGLTDLVHPDEVPTVERELQALLEGTETHWRCERRFLSANGDVVGVLHSASAVSESSSLLAGAQNAGESRQLVHHLEDITERKSFERQLEHRALHDSLTKLPNRALLIDRLEQALGTNVRGSQLAAPGVALLFLDVDRFKSVNDTLGHHAGDVVLQAVAQRLDMATRPGDTASRLAGDEFVVVFEDSSPERAAIAANRMAQLLAEPFTVSGTGVAVTASIGIALSRPGVSTPDSLLLEADAAMYAVKQQGGGGVGIFDEVLAAQLGSRLQLEGELRAGIAQDQLRLHFQPEVSLIDGTVVGLEALVRWEHPSRGLVPPLEFIPLAEETGQIGALGAWVLDRALAEAARRRASDPDYTAVMWVNLSPSQVADPALAVNVRAALRKHSLPGEALGLEITESVIMSDKDSARLMLAVLRAMGVGLAIDDFGTGYSSLSYLAEFPVDTVKIDQSFTSGLDDPQRRRESYAVVSAVVGLAHALDLRIVAEGVETVSQAQALQGLGCDYAQGYLLGRPTPEGDSVYGAGLEAVGSSRRER